MRNYRELKVWEKSHFLTLMLYKATTIFPKEEIYGLTSQIRRAASSIPANIAEGCGRKGNAEMAHFLHIAAGSASELDYHLLLAKDLGFIETAEYDKYASELSEVRRMLTAFIQKVKALT